jgi:Ran GTPase-activating protein (RanGAP) involved in mRNA processing and transport
MGTGTSKQHSHGQEFQPKTRKTASEVWNEFVRDAIENPSDAKFESIIKQLKEDTDSMLCNQPISDLCFVLPRAKGQNARGLFAKELVNRYFTNTEDELGIRIQFNRLLARLADHHRLIEATEFSEQAQFRQSRGNDYGNVWERIREESHRPLGDNVAQPGPDPVDRQANPQDLKPLLDWFQSGSEIVTNHYAKSVKAEVMRFPVGSVFPDGRLDLFKQGVGQDLVSPLITAIQSSKRIKHVQLGNNFISLIGAKKIGELVTEGKSEIETWYLGGNEFDRSCLDLLCHGLLEDTHCKSLWLKRNPVKPEGAVFLRRLLEENETIELLDLQNTGLFDSGLQILLEGLCHNRSVETLYLDANGITAEGAAFVANYFHYLSDTAQVGVKRLWLSMNRLQDEGTALILRSLKSYIHLESLSLGSNGCSAIVAQQLYECLVDSTNLKHLDIGMYKATADLQELTNRISDEGVPYIAKLVAENKNLRALSVSCNGISNEGLRVLLEEGVKKSDSLVHLEYHQYGLKIDEEIKREIESKLELNWIAMKLDMTKYEYVRFLKHSPLVQFIDSIYK